jgi:flagellar biosynthesis protein FliQ
VFCFLVGRMMVSALLKEPYWGLRGGTINYRVNVSLMFGPLIIGVLNVALSYANGGKLLFDESYPLIIYFFVSMVIYAHFAVNVILEFTRGLDFYCFDLAKKFVATDTPDPNGDKQTTLASPFIPKKDE